MLYDLIKAFPYTGGQSGGRSAARFMLEQDGLLLLCVFHRALRGCHRIQRSAEAEDWFPLIPITQLVAPLPELSVETSQGVVRHSLRTLLSLDDAAVYEHGTDTLDSNYGYEVFESTNPFATVRLVVEEPVL